MIPVRIACRHVVSILGIIAVEFTRPLEQLATYLNSVEYTRRPRHAVSEMPPHRNLELAIQ